MTKKDIVRSVHKSLGIDQNLVQVAVQQVLDAVLETLAREGRVELRNFGVFEVKQRAARKARNPRTGEKVDVDKKHFVTFSAGKELRRRIECPKVRDDDLAKRE